MTFAHTKSASITTSKAKGSPHHLGMSLNCVTPNFKAQYFVYPTKIRHETAYEDYFEVQYPADCYLSKL